MRAYVLIDSPRDKARDVVARLRDRRFVLVADTVHGPHSVVAVLEDADLSTIAKTVLFEVRKIDGVDDITVFLALDDQELEAQGKDTFNGSLDGGSLVDKASKYPRLGKRIGGS